MKFWKFFLPLTVIANVNSQEMTSPSAMKFQDLIGESLDKNFQIKISEGRKQEAFAQEMRSKGLYDLTITGLSSYRKADTPVASSLDGSSARSIVSTTKNYQLTLKKTFSFGPTLSVPYQMQVVDNPSTFRITKKTYEPNLAFDFSMPLLQTLRPGYWQKDLYEKSLDSSISAHQEKKKIEDTLWEILENFLDTKLLFHEIVAKQVAMKKAELNLEFITHKEQLGKANALERLEAESAFEKMKYQLMDVEQRYLKSKEALISKSTGQTEGDLDFSTYDQLAMSLTEIPLAAEEELIEQALQKRADSEQKNVELSKEFYRTSNAKWDLIPQIDVKATKTYRGLDATTSQANDQIKDQKYPSDFASATLTYPLLNYGPRANLKIQELKEKRKMIELDTLKRDITLEVRDAYRNFSSKKIQEVAYQKSFQAQQHRYSMVEAKHHQGMISTFELTQSLFEKLESEVSYQRSHSDLLKAYYELAKTQGSLGKALGL